jgi:hypothetical protein
LYSDSSEVVIGLPFVLWIRDNGTGCQLAVQYATQTGNPFPVKPSTIIRLLDDYNDIIDQAGAGVVEFTQNSVNFAVNRDWVEAVYEGSSGGAIIVIRDGRTRFLTDESYAIIRARFIVCPPTGPPSYLIDAENGLYVANDTTVRMGGFLIENTRVQLEGYPLTFIDTTAKQSFGVGAGTLPGYLGDTVGYFARRSGGFRQFILQGNRYNQIVIRDTSSVFGDYAEIYQGLYFGDKPFMYFDVTDREFDGKISRISIDADSVSFRNSPYLSSIDAYIRYFTAKAGRISMGAIEGELGITGTGVEMGAYGYGVGGGASEYLFMKTKAVDNGTASVGQYLKLLNTSTGEVEFATIDLSGYLQTSDTAAMLDPYIQGAGSVNSLAKFTAGRVIGNAAITENGSRVVMGLPMQLKEYSLVGLPTGVTKDMYWITGEGPAWYQGARLAYGLESTFNRGTSTRIPFFDANGQLTQSINHAYNVSNGAFSVGTPILANIGSSFLSELPITAAFYGTVNNGVRSSFTISTAGWGRPGATTISVNGSQIHGYDGFLHFINNGFAGGSVSGSGFFTSKNYILGYTPGPSNTSNLFINSTNINEYTQGANYPSGSNYYNIEASLQSVIAANNTGQTAVRAGLQVSGRYLNFKNDQGVVIGSTNATTSVPNSSAALDINYSTRGLLPPRGSATSNITRGIGSLTIVSGGSGYGTGTGVVITISGGGGNGAAISLTYTAGVITGATLILRGTSYTSAPTITISGGTGTGAVITCALDPYPDGLMYYNTTTKTHQYYQTTNNRFQDFGSYQSDNLHVVDSFRLQNTPSLSSITGLLTRDANGWVGLASVGTGLSYAAGVLSVTGGTGGGGSSILDSLGNGSITIDANTHDLLFDDLGTFRVTQTGGNEIKVNSTEVSILGKVKAKQEGYYTITSTSSPQTLSNDYSDNLINQGGTQASFTFQFPASPADGQILTLTYNNAISTLTLDGNGNTIVGSAVTTAVAGSQRKFKFYSGIGWVKIY